MTPRSISILMAAGIVSASHLEAQAATLFGVVDTGELFVSADQGATWEVRSTLSVHDGVGLVARAASDDLFLATRSGAMYHSTNAGIDWSEVGGAETSDVEATAARQDGALLLLTATGTVWLSTDQGVTFTPLAALTGSNHVSLARTSSGVFYALTATGEVSKSLDGGESWILVGAIPVSDAVELISYGAELFVLAGAGEVARSTDQGITWTMVGTLSQVYMTALTVLPAGNGLLASTREGEVATSPDGVTWTWAGTIDQLQVTALANDTPASGSVDGEGSATAQFRAGLPWPNPAAVGSGAVSFPFTLPRVDTVELEVYNVAGRLVAHQPPKSFAAGSNVLRWAPGLEVAGLYFVRLVTGSGGRVSARWTLAR